MRLIFLFLILCSCATRNDLSNQYREKLQETRTRQAQRTNILFLIDGLPHSVLEQQLKNGSLPHIKKFFLNDGQTLQKTHAAFPTVTFTNISGILKEKPVHQTNAHGNKIISNNRRIDFESLDDRPQFSTLMRGITG